MAINPTTLPKEGFACEPCLSGSQTRNLSDEPMQRCKVPGDRIHSDICGWIDPIALGDSKYILTFTDDATRMTYLFVIKTKSALEVRNCFLEFRNVFERDGRRVKTIRTDGGGEYRKQMAALCKETGIHHEEYDALMKNGAWELTEMPPDKNLVTCKWVFKAKQDANG